MNTVLARQQAAFANAIRTNSESSLPGGLLQPTPQGEPARLQIYAHAYRIRLGEALSENFPVLARVLGDASFTDLVATFLRDCPSRRPSIRWFGEALADFVAREPQVLPHPSLHDLIRMEWALSTAFDEADADPLTVSDLLAVSPDAWAVLRFVPHPTLRLLELNWNVEPLWSALIANENADTSSPEELRHHLLIWRFGIKTHWRSVAPIEARLLTACIAGEAFEQLCDIAAEDAGDSAAVTVAGYLRIWVEAGLLVDMSGNP